jgi:hypothetical protein
MSDEVRDVYRRAIGELSDEAFKRAAETLVRNFVPTSQVPFPLPAHFLSAAGVSGPQAVMQAMALLKTVIQRNGYYDSVSFKDKAMHSTIRAMGGWTAISNWTDKDWQLNEGRFIEYYKASRGAGNDGPDYLPGFFEIDNRSRGHDEHIPPVKVYDSAKYAETNKIEMREVPQKQLCGIDTFRIGHETSSGELTPVSDVLGEV